jgi:hypothetical protein
MKDYKPHHSGYIYLRVNIKKYALHRLVALTFIENPENNSHAHKIGLNKGSKREIIQYDLEMNEIQKFNKIKDASIKLTICYSSIKAVLKGKQKSSKGFIFKYLEE